MSSGKCRPLCHDLDVLTQLIWGEIQNKLIVYSPGCFDGSPSRDARFRLFGWLDDISSTHPIITHQNIHFKAWIFPINAVDSLIFFHWYMADILLQYICWTHWKFEKIKTVGVISYPPHLTILAWVFSHFFYWLTTKCPHVIPKCEQLSYQYIQPTLVTYNKSCEWCEEKKANFPNKSLVGDFLSNYCGRETVMTLTDYGINNISSSRSTRLCHWKTTKGSSIWIELHTLSGKWAFC